MAALVALTVGLIDCAAPQADAQSSPGPDPEPALELLGRLGGPMARAAVVPPMAYLPMGPGVAALDVSDPADPKMLGRHDFWSNGVRDVVAIDHYVYALTCGHHSHLLNHYCSVRVLDWSDPAKPVELDSIGVGRVPAIALSLDAADNRLYAVSFDTLVVIDVSLPDAPVALGWFDSGVYGSAMAAAGGHAYLLDTRTGPFEERTPDQLVVLDATDPTVIKTVATVLVADETRGVAVRGDMLLISDDNGLHTYDVSKPSEPVAIGFVDLPGDPQSMDVVGDLVYVAAGDGGVRVVDISDGEHPEELPRHIYTHDEAHYVTVAGDRAFVVDAHAGLHIAEIYENGNARNLGDFHGVPSPRRLAAAGDHVLVADSLAGLLIVDVSRPELPAVVARHEWTVESVAAVGNHGFLAGGDIGLWVIDLSVLPELDVLGTRYGGFASEIAVEGSTVYATHGTRMSVIDVSDPTAPTVVGHATLPADGGRLDVQDGFVFAAAGSTLTSVSVANPAQPTVAGILVLDKEPADVAVSGPVAYVASGSPSLNVVDVTAPSDMALIGTVSMPELGLRQWYAPSAVTVANDRLYIGDSGQPSREIGSLHVTYDERGIYTRYAGALPGTSARAQDVTVSGDMAYVADELGGLLIARVAPAPSTVGLLLPAVLKPASYARESR